MFTAEELLTVAGIMETDIGELKRLVQKEVIRLAEKGERI